MATEILVNDGGAPARILPYIAEVALTGGQLVTASTTSGQVVLADSALANQQKHAALGYCLVDAALGGVASIVTGKGVQLNVQADPTHAADALCIGAVAGELRPCTAVTTAAGFPAIAQILKTTGEGDEALAAAGLWRVQTI
tara:strand:- start:5027 stop:5452 length:426 start_codon:yes stop_codon:yes gene_type:complete